jgi:hypothetical protein
MREVGDEGLCRRQFPYDRRNGVGIPSADQDVMGAPEVEGDGLADSTGCAGDECDRAADIDGFWFSHASTLRGQRQ